MEECCYAEPMWTTTKSRGSLSELKNITSFYYPQNPVWHSGDGLPGLGPCGEGLNCFEWQATWWGLEARDKGKRKSALFLNMFGFYFLRYKQRLAVWALCERTQCLQQYFSQTLCRPHTELNGALVGITEAFWGVAWLPRDLALSSSFPIDQEDAWGAGSSTILGRGPWRFGAAESAPSWGD